MGESPLMHCAAPTIKKPTACWRCAGVLAACWAAASIGFAEGPLLSRPTERLDQLVPRSALEGLTLPAGPVRVAGRPNLDWRPGLLSASQAERSEPADDASGEGAPKAASEDASTQPDRPRLRPMASAPLLVPPSRTEPAPADKTPEAAPEPSAAEPKLHRAAPSVSRLPEQVERKKAGDDRRAAPAEKKPTASKSGSASKANSKTAPTSKPPTEEKANQKRAATEKPTAKASDPRKSDAKPKASDAAPEAEAKDQPEAAKTPPPKPLSRSLRNLRSRMRTVLSFYYRKPLNTMENDPWEIMHGMLSYELHSRVRDGGPRGNLLTAVGHLCFNRPSKRQQMMAVTEDGQIDVRVGVGLQGHKGQLLAMLAQCNVSPDYPIRVDGREFKIHDLIASEQKTCYARTELTFKLIGLGHYLGSDAKWLNEQGESWDIPRLIKEEREQPIRGAACGGTHRLSGLSLAFRRREARDEPLDGEYAEAARFVSQYQSYAFRLQNPDGSLSTEWFRGRGVEEDIDRRLRTSGHTLEWLAYSLPDDQLRSHGTVRAVNYLTNLLAGNADHEWHNGSLAHALHALVVYDKRVFRPHDDLPTDQIAAIDPAGNLFRGYPIYRGVMRNSPPQPTGFFGLFGGSRTGSNSGRRTR